jgi:hypothetical protein
MHGGAYGFGDRTLQKIHPAGGAEVQRKNVEKNAYENKDEQPAAQPAKPCPRVENFHWPGLLNTEIGERR